MTIDELKKEAEDYIKKENLEWELECYRVSAIGAVIEAYLAGAEPREKRIAELEIQLAISEHDREHNAYELTEVYKKVAELEQKNAELKKQVEQKQHLADVRLEQSLENYKLFSDERKARIDVDIALEDMTDNLTKAKEIIRKFSEFVNNKVEYGPEHPQEHTDLWNELCEQAEQFLNSEVEK